MEDRCILKILEAKKETLFARVQRLYDESKLIANPVNLNNFLIRYETLEETKEQFLNIVEKINEVSLVIDENFTPSFAAADSFDELYCHIQKVRRDILMREQQQLSSNVNNQNSSTDTGLNKSIPRLPIISLLKFSGDLKDWPMFSENFKSLIHDNSSLTDIDKVHYLLGQLSDKALSVCAGIPPIGANYSIIWKALNDKYEDKRLLANNYLDQMLDFKPAQTESASSLNNFLAKFDAAVRALKKLEINDLSDYIISYLALKKLDPETIRRFENTCRQSSLPTYEQIVTFVSEQEKICSRILVTNKASFSSNVTKAKVSHSFISTLNNNKTGLNNNECSFCNNGSHSPYSCNKFVPLTATDRYKLVREKNRCINCLGSHKVLLCRSKSRCKTCGLKHHSLLHFKNDRDAAKNNSSFDRPNQENSIVENQNNNVRDPQSPTLLAEPCSSKSSALTLCSMHVTSAKLNTTVLLSTAVVNIVGQDGKLYKGRFLLDSASQRNILTLNCCKRLNLPISKTSCTIRGIGVSSNAAEGQVQFIISSLVYPKCRYSVEALVVDNITNKLPQSEVQMQELAYLKKLPLADSQFYIPGEIDGILGSELFPHLLGQDRIIGPPHLPVAIETTLGYVILGKAPINSSLEVIDSFCTIIDSPLESLIQSFWKIEEVPNVPMQNPDDIKCENIFLSTFKREVSGRYTVSLPFKYNPTKLGESYSTALKRFLLLEKKFRSDALYKEQYVQIIREYLDTGYIRKVTDTLPSELCYYIPHRGVFKATSSSTPLRVVYDASCPSDSSFSLNDLLFTGPKLQRDVISMFLNFRLFEIALTSDVRRMYLQIDIRKQDRRFQRILWRFNENEPIDTYELTTVTFGVKSSPFLALRTVHQLAKDEANRCPVAAQYAMQDMYMDDFVSSVSTIDKAKMVYLEMVDMFKAGGFDLVKWAVNSKDLLDFIPIEKHAPNVIHFDTDFLKVLGMQWRPNSDILFFKLNLEHKICTKRNILSTIARIYDPLGLIAPVTLKLKLFIKQLWLLKLEWDATPPDSFLLQWKEFYNELPLLENFIVPRHIGVFENSNSIIVGMADACSSSFGAVVFLRTTIGHGINSNLVCAKTKVAPLKVVSIPRLELCAAHLLAKLIRFVIDNFSRINIDRIYALSDSTVTLNWINSSPHKWKTFVSNRVSKIQDLVPASNWFHIDGKLNVADGLSRGLSPSRFIGQSEWITGPSWLKSDESLWPIKSVKLMHNEHFVEYEEKVTNLLVTDREVNPLYSLINRCSTWRKMLHSTVHVLRFAKLLPIRKLIISSDLEAAEHILLKIVQATHFGNEINSLQLNKECSHSLRKLRPFLKNGLLRVGGRLSYSKLDFDSQHPLLLPKKDPFTDLLIDYYHRRNLHTGPNLVLSLLRQRYWILSARGVIRSRIAKCIFCFRANPKPQFPLMGDLPPCRVQEAKPFLFTGTDFAGPVNIIWSKKRGIRSQKAYICLFICLTTKAVHLELCSDLSTPNFLQAFKRFLSRRGLCSTIYSDCGTNYVGAKTLLHDMYKHMNSLEFQEALINELAPRGISWKMNPPAAPHMGGIWESNIKAMKTHLYKVLGSQILTYEEMNTLLIQIEALLNSRPLSILSSDPSDPIALTPSHFLTLTPIDRLPAADLSNIAINRLDRYQLIDKMVQSYWKRWHIDYLHTLQTRERWNTPSNPIEIGKVVVLQQPNVPPLHWPIGRIVEIFPGADGIIRVVSVKTSKGIFKRPVVKVCPLPIQ